MARLDVKAALGEALVLPLVAMDLPKRGKAGAVKLGIEPHQVPELARLMSYAGPENEVTVLPEALAMELLDELDHLDRVAPRLEAPGRVNCRFRAGVDGDLAINLAGNGYQSLVYFRRFPWPTEYGWTHPGMRWWGNESRCDALGRVWTRQLGELVMDDFGTLVTVEGGAE